HVRGRYPSEPDGIYTACIVRPQHGSACCHRHQRGHGPRAQPGRAASTCACGCTEHTGRHQDCCEARSAHEQIRGGGMAAVIGMELADLETLCDELSTDD